MDPDSSTQVLSQIGLLLLLTLINAFFSASEMAIVSVNKNKIRTLSEEGNKSAMLVEKLLEEPTNFLSTIQVAITLAGFFSSAMAATGLSEPLGNLLSSLGVPYSGTIAFVLVTVILAFVNLVFGELVPKRIALLKAEKVSLFVVRPVRFVGKIAYPFIKLLSLTTSLVLRMLGMHSETLEEEVSEEEIRSMLAVGKESGVFNETEQDMIEGIFEFDDILADEIMTPRTNVYSIDINDPLSEYLDELMEMKHSRIPVYDDSIDNIIGILYIKDFVVQAHKVGFDNVDISSILRKPYFVPESKNIDVLFRDLQTNHQQIAILVDEYGGFSGIVTMEDVIEEIMGNIQDEYDEDEVDFLKVDKNTYILAGNYDISDLNEETHLNIPDDEHDTINGFLLNELGYIPEDKEKPVIKTEDADFYVLNVENKRINKVKMVLHLKKDEDEKTEEDTKKEEVR